MNILIPKKSSVTGKAPLATDLQVGELAINLADKKIFSKDASGAIVTLGSGAGGAGSAPQVEYLSGDGTATIFTLQNSYTDSTYVSILVEGQPQFKNTYTLSGKTLTFTEAPPSGTNNIEVTGGATLQIGTPNDGTVTSQKLASGAVVGHLGYTPANDALLAAVAKSGSAADLSGVLSKARLPAGTVLQVVHASTGVNASTSGSTYIDTNLSASITPLSSTSKILVLVSQQVETYASNSTIMGLKLQRNGTDIYTNNRAWGDNTNAANDLHGTASIMFLDSPASTSALTYKTQFCAANNASGPYGNYVAVQSASGNSSTITLLEIAA